MQLKPTWNLQQKRKDIHNKPEIEKDCQVKQIFLPNQSYYIEEEENMPETIQVEKEDEG